MDSILHFTIIIVTGITNFGTVSGFSGSAAVFYDFGPVRALAFGRHGQHACYLPYLRHLACRDDPYHVQRGTRPQQPRGGELESRSSHGMRYIFGGLTVGTLASYLSSGIVLRTFFALLSIFMAVRMVWHIRSCEVCEPGGSPRIYIAIGFFIGILYGLARIGGAFYSCRCS